MLVIYLTACMLALFGIAKIKVDLLRARLGLKLIYMKQLRNEIQPLVDLYSVSYELQQQAGFRGAIMENKYLAWSTIQATEYRWWEIVTFTGLRVRTYPSTGAEYRELKFHIEYEDGFIFPFRIQSDQLEKILREAGYEMHEPSPLQLVLIFDGVSKGQKVFRIIYPSDAKD